MSNEPTKKELQLAARVNELDDAAARPVLGDGGLFAAAVKFLMSRVSRGMVAAVLAIFIAFHAWEAFNDSQQWTAELQSKRAEAGKAIAEAGALNKKAGEETTERATRIAEMRKIQAEADAAQAEADAATHSVDGVPARLAQLRAELEQKRADADRAQAEANAALQEINGIPAAVVQKRADVAAAEAEAKSETENIRLMLRYATDPDFIGHQFEKSMNRVLMGR